VYAHRASVHKVVLLGICALGLAAPSAVRAAAISADISVTKVLQTPAPVHPGELLTYLITVDNNGPDAALNIVLTDPVPFNTTFDSFDTGASGIVCTTPAVGGTGTVTCPFAATHPSVPMGESYEFEMRIRVGPSGGSKAVANTAIVTSDAPDPVPDNNSSTAQAEIDVIPEVPVSGAGLFAMGLALAASGLLFLKR
jgi:uncharacterized repeat protein (TIGR01451 family)